MVQQLLLYVLLLLQLLLLFPQDSPLPRCLLIAYKPLRPFL